MEVRTEESNSDVGFGILGGSKFRSDYSEEIEGVSEGFSKF